MAYHSRALEMLLYKVMITGENIVYQIDDKTSASCENFSFSHGVNYLNYQKKDIYDILSFSYSSLKEGSLVVDGVSFQPDGFIGGSAEIIKLNVKKLGSIFLVIFKKDSAEADDQFHKLVSEIKTLKSKIETIEDKKHKIDLLMTVLSLNSVSYLLLDFNNPIAEQNHAIWEGAFSDYPGCVIILLKALVADTAKKKEIKIGKNTSLIHFYHALITFLAFLSIFLTAWGRSQQIKDSSLGPLLIVFGCFLILGDIILIAFFDKKNILANATRNALISCEVWSAVFNAIGAFLALGISWLLSEKIAFFSKGLFQGSGLAIEVLMVYALLSSPFLIGHIIYSGNAHSKY